MYKYFVRQLGYYCFIIVERFRVLSSFLIYIFFLLFFSSTFCFPYTCFLLISKSFATYGYCPPCIFIFRLLRFHLGTIAFGSLVIAIIQIIRIILKTVEYIAKVIILYYFDSLCSNDTQFFLSEGK